MKGHRGFVVMGLCLAVVLGWATWAAALPMLTIDRINNYYSGNGGEFNITGTPFTGNYHPKAIVENGFETFCLEKNEFVTIPGKYYYSVSDSAMAGGAGGPQDPISIGTAWLYSQFARGTLANYAYDDFDCSDDNCRARSAGYLQEIIWYLEEEIGSISTENPFVDMVLDQFTTLGAARADSNGAYSVRVLNLWENSDGTGNKQDQLVLPEPGTLFLMGFGLLGLGLAARRLKRRA
jgi:hypothetical protein